MISNRSVPPCTVIPVLSYPDVGVAADWLCKAFGFTVRLRIADHRIQLKAGDGCIVLAEGSSVPADSAHLVMVRVPDADGHHERARLHGALVLAPPTDFAFGERQYNAQDFAGHRWTFTQSIADVAPEQWGGVAVTLE
jgi:uncharacterized glyoxalase superfamily protein PhnB